MTQARDRAAPTPAEPTLSTVSTVTSPPGPYRAPRLDRWILSVAAVRAAVTDLCARYAVRALRLSLALVFVWFGVLKLSGDSPVKGLLSATLPFLDPGVTVPALGLVEVALGVAVAIGRAPRVMLLALAAHLSGTFLAFITATHLVIQHGNPLLLTADGEFVVKNLVLISAALVLVGRSSRRTNTGSAALKGPRPGHGLVPELVRADRPPSAAVTHR
jgi:putative oxidoreductase